METIGDPRCPKDGNSMLYDHLGDYWYCACVGCNEETIRGYEAEQEQIRQRQREGRLL